MVRPLVYQAAYSIRGLSFLVNLSICRFRS
jgi:hypothetical protein